MRKLLFIFITTLLLCSCYKNEDLNEYDEYYYEHNPSEYLWYYNKKLFANAKYCQLIGELISPNCNKIIYLNRRCYIFDYTIYPVKRYDLTDFCSYCHTEHKIYRGNIVINNIGYFRNIKLN